MVHLISISTDFWQSPVYVFFVILEAEKLYFKWENVLCYTGKIKDFNALVRSKQYYLFVMYLYTVYTTTRKRAPLFHGISFAFCNIHFHKSQNTTSDKIIFT